LVTIMASDTELTRLADMATALRPDWPARSVRAYLATKHRQRAFADLAVALAVVACDPASETPARLDEPSGPWWRLTRLNTAAVTTFTPGPGGDPPCRRPGHEHERLSACRACRAEALAGDEPDAGGRPVPAPSLRALVRGAS
jgi:hypothetical protein